MDTKEENFFGPFQIFFPPSKKITPEPFHGNGDTIRIGREIQRLLFMGFFLLTGRFLQLCCACGQVVAAAAATATELLTDWVVVSTDWVWVWVSVHCVSKWLLHGVGASGCQYIGCSEQCV